MKYQSEQLERDGYLPIHTRVLILVLLSVMFISRFRRLRTFVNGLWIPAGTEKIPDKDLLNVVKEDFDLRPGMILTNLNLEEGWKMEMAGFGLWRMATYGHFRRDDR